MIKIIQGDITTLQVDVIVNAANQMMLGGSLRLSDRGSGGNRGESSARVFVSRRERRGYGSRFLLLLRAGQVDL